MSGFVLQGHCSVVTTETTWCAKSKLFAIWLFIENDCWPPFQMQYRFLSETLLGPTNLHSSHFPLTPPSSLLFDYVTCHNVSFHVSFLLVESVDTAVSEIPKFSASAHKGYIKRYSIKSFIKLPKWEAI